MMQIKILTSIRFNELMPWNFNLDNSKSIVSKIRAAGSNEPVSGSELVQQLIVLLDDYPVLIKWLKKEDTNLSIPLLEPFYCPTLPEYDDIVTKYYSLIVSKECLRVFNSFSTKSKKWSDSIDINYNSTGLLKIIKNLTKQVIEEIKARELEEDSANKKLTQFVLQYLKNSLVALFFNIQEINCKQLDQVVTLGEYCLFDLELLKSDIENLINRNTTRNEIVDAQEYKSTQPKLSFGFKGDLVKLTTIINQLNFQIDLLNEDVADSDELLKVLTVKKLLPSSTKIQINCETRIFRYVIDKLQPFFNDLSLANIEKSLIFYSKKDRPLTANNLSVSNKNNSGEPKEKATIDKIFK